MYSYLYFIDTRIFKSSQVKMMNVNSRSEVFSAVFSRKGRRGYFYSDWLYLDLMIYFFPVAFFFKGVTKGFTPGHLSKTKVTTLQTIEVVRGMKMMDMKKGAWR